ncbi:MAG: tryptophan--tRNA ligase [Acidimicrobiia bacterium]|nr:tryptophan--tRNA ligase [Acidimicrobiia bacterium]
MSSPADARGRRVLTGYRPTGKLHLGHLLGNIQANLALQETNECYFFVADWHALTSGYEDTSDLHANVVELVADLVAAGLEPERATIYRQSDLPEVAELNLYLSMITPLGWLERNPTHKEQLRELSTRQINTIGNLGYPVLQTADITLVDGEVVPVGEDQLPHLEIAREIVRRLAHIYGEGLLLEPSALVSGGARVLGWDGRKMSKSYGNAVFLDDAAETVAEKLRQYITDPEKIRLKDPGRPEICSVFALHGLFTPAADVAVVDAECRAGERGCVACKAELAQNVNAMLDPIRTRKAELGEDEIGDILAEGARRVRPVATKTIERVRRGIRL